MRDGIVATIQTPFARVGFDSNRSGIGIRGLTPGGSNFGTFFPAFNKPQELAAGCEKRTAAGGSLPVRLEPRSRRAERGDGDREGRSRPVVPQPHVRARLSPRELVLTWLIDAPHKRPFRCWTELVLLQQWFASAVFTRAASRLAYAFNDRPAGMAKRIRKFAQA
jgi:hypothetical protein